MSYKVMIVDDDKLTVSLLKTLLELDGFEVVSVAEGTTAYQRAREDPPDAFLVDYHLSDGEGTDFVVQMRADPDLYQLPVVMTSGLNREDEAMQAGADWFLIKPFDPSDLVDVFQRLLESTVDGEEEDSW
ncbi:MAG: response regulator [Anaerolineae bacterium]|nr:response regulator [Anaerolineae bacterium]